MEHAIPLSELKKLAEMTETEIRELRNTLRNYYETASYRESLTHKAGIETIDCFLRFLELNTR